jgi:hypothetical protein
MPTFDQKALTLLKKPLLARLATVGTDGYPHVVPVWFMLDGNDIVFISSRDTRKVKNLQANPKGAVSVGGAPDDGGGLLIKGNISVEEDPEDRWVKKFCYHYEDKSKAEQDIADWADVDIILLRLKPATVTSI